MKNFRMVKSMVFSYFWVLALGLVMFSFKMFLMKKLPVNEYALFDYSYGLMSLFCFIGMLGLPYITVRFIAQGYSPSLIKKHFFSAIKYSSPAVMILFFGLWLFTLSDNYPTFLFASLGAIGLIVFYEYLAIFKGFKEYVTSGFKYNAYMLSTFSVFSFVLLYFFNIKSAATILFLHFLILSLFIFVVRSTHKQIAVGPGLKEIGRRQFLFYGFSIFCLGMNGELTRNIDKIFVAKLLDLSQLGIYLAAIVFVLPYSLLCNVIETVMFPYLKENLNLKRVMGLVSLLAIMTNILYLFGIEKVIRFLVHSQLLNQNYLESLPLIKILSVGYSFLLIYAISASVVIYSAERKKLWHLFIWDFSFGVILAIILNYLFVKSYGIKGAAYATDICLFFRVLIWTAFAQPYLQLKKEMTIASPSKTAAEVGKNALIKSYSGGYR
jgi:O-antigen/teichoic acid export membrane protein